MLQRRMLQSTFVHLPLAFELLSALSSARQERRSPQDNSSNHDMDLGGDDVALAQQLALFLKPLASSLSDLFGQGKVIVVRSVSHDQTDRIMGILEAAVTFAYGDAGFIKTDKTNDVRHPLILSSGKLGFLSSATGALSDAYRTGSFVFCVLTDGYEDENTRSVTAGADLHGPLPKVDRDIVQQVFSAIFGTVPAELNACGSFDAIDGTHLGAIVRPTRAIDECVSQLMQAIGSGLKPADVAAESDNDALSNAYGYGGAKDWASNLVVDYSLWKEGQLDWQDIPDRGVLLSGAPGTGKSSFPKLVAKALAVPLIATSVAEWNAHKNLSGTLAQMTEVFASIRQSGGILLIDELDGIGRRDRSEDSYRAYWDQIINQTLTLVGGAMATPGVILVCATNYPNRIDPALLRAGRIDRHIHIELPDKTARAGILTQYLKGALSISDIGTLAGATHGCSGADLERLVRTASADSRRKRQPFGLPTLMAELARPYAELDSSDQRRIVTYFEGQSLVAELLDIDVAVKRVLPTLADLRDQLTVLLAGAVAEEIIFGQSSILAEPDLAKATGLAEAIEHRWGMGSIGLVSGQGIKVSPMTVAQHLNDAALRAGRLLSDNLGELEQRASAGRALPQAADKVRTLATLH